MDLVMDPSQASSRERSQRAIDSEIGALKLRRNALSPISSLPLEVFEVIFSILCLPGSTRGGNPDYHLARFRVSQVSHQWREIALNYRFLWSHVDFTTLSSQSAAENAAEILARAKSAPLYFEANFPNRDDVIGRRFKTFRKELQARIPYIRRLRASHDPVLLYEILEEIASPAPTLEYLSLSASGVDWTGWQTYIRDTLFNGSAPRLSCLKLRYCNISWKSPLFKRLEYLKILTPAAEARPNLAVWLDALDEMPQLRTLILHSASPIAPSFPFDVDRTVTLPSLTCLDILASTKDCALALAHLDLPVLTCLYLTIISPKYDRQNSSDVQTLLKYVARHVHWSQDTRPLQTAIHHEYNRADILAWPVPNIDLELQDSLTTALPTGIALSFERHYLSHRKPYEHIDILDTMLAGLPMDGIMTLVSCVENASYRKRNLSTERFWLKLSQKWPLLQRVLLTPHSAHGFLVMLLEDNGEHKGPLFPSLTELGIISLTTDEVSSLPLCRALMNRVEQGVPVKTLDLRMCVQSYMDDFPKDWLRPFNDIGVEVLVSEFERDWEAREQIKSMWKTVARGPFVNFGDDKDDDRL